MAVGCDVVKHGICYERLCLSIHLFICHTRKNVAQRMQHSIYDLQWYSQRLLTKKVFENRCPTLDSNSLNYARLPVLSAIAEFLSFCIIFLAVIWYDVGKLAMWKWQLNIRRILGWWRERLLIVVLRTDGRAVESNWRIPSVGQRATAVLGRSHQLLSTQQ